MALFKIFKGKAENLPLDIHEGYAYLTTDTGELYVDVDASTRKQISAEKLSRTRDGFTETIEIDDLILMQDHIENKENPHKVTTDQIGAVPKTTTINGKTLSENITLTTEDIGASKPGNTFIITLTNEGWIENNQTINNEYFNANGYIYIVNPSDEDFNIWTESMIYAYDVTKEGQMTFICNNKPEQNITVKIIKMEAIEI